MKAVGCEQCRGTGYRGRMGIFEIFVIDDDVRHMINNKELDPALCASERASWACAPCARTACAKFSAA